MDFFGVGVNIDIVTRSLGPHSVNESRLAYLDDFAWIAYSRPSLRDEVSTSPSLHFGRILATRKLTFNLTVSLEDTGGQLKRFSFFFDTSTSQSLAILVPNPGVYRVTYSESGSSRETGSIWDLGSKTDRFTVGNDEEYIGRVEMRDFGVGVDRPWQAWAIFFVVLGIGGFVLFCVAIIVFVKLHVWDWDESEPSESISDLRERRKSQAEVGMVKAIKGGLKEEYQELQGPIAVIRWVLFVIARAVMLVLMLVVAYLGFVTLFYFTVLCIVSFAVALFLNALLNRDTLDLQVQVVMWIYFIPLCELLISLNLSVIQGFFSELWVHLDFETVTRALTIPRVSEHQFIGFTRLAWYIYYFCAMACMFVICLLSRGTDLSSYVGSAFVCICLVVPLCAALRPILSAWTILLSDRTSLEVSAAEPPEEREQNEDSLCEFPDEPDEDPVGPPDTAEDGSKCRLACGHLVGHHMQFLFDPIGLLSDETWLDFLRSGFTGHARPQRDKWWTWIVVCCVFAWVAALISLDVIRLVQAIEDHDVIRRQLSHSLETISAMYELDFLDPEFTDNISIITG
jgi:hypothetical protein